MAVDWNDHSHRHLSGAHRPLSEGADKSRQADPDRSCVHGPTRPASPSIDLPRSEPCRPATWLGPMHDRYRDCRGRASGLRVSLRDKDTLAIPTGDRRPSSLRAVRTYRRRWASEVPTHNLDWREYTRCGARISD